MKENTNILKTIKKSDKGFSVPEGYFDNFKINIDRKVHSGFRVPDTYFHDIKDTVLKEINSDISTIGTGFNTPESYFQEFEVDLPKKKRSVRILGLVTRKRLNIANLAIAASFILFFGIKIFIKTPESTGLENLTIREMENWIDDDLVVFNTNDITETYGDLEIETEIIFNDNEITDYFNDKDLERIIPEN